VEAGQRVFRVDRQAFDQRAQERAFAGEGGLFGEMPQGQLPLLLAHHASRV
jgi:hypothetical protein